MKKCLIGLVLFLGLFSTFSLSQLQSKAEYSGPDFGRIPLYFIPNKGQLDNRIHYYASTPQALVWLTESEIIFNKHGHNVRFLFENINSKVMLQPVNKADYIVNYFLGNDSSKWKTGIETSKGVIYAGIYPGIDFKVYGTGSKIEYDWIAAPGSEPSQICFSFPDSERVDINKQGDLIIHADGGRMEHTKPRAYQIIEGRKVHVEAAFEKKEINTCGFAVGSYNTNYALIIDPVVALKYSTYLGGNGFDYGYGIDVDSAGSAYIVGQTGSTNFPLANPYQGTIGGADADVFVTKFSEDGTSLVYSTYLGGSDADRGEAIAVDASGCAHITGVTSNTDYPAVNAFQSSHGGGTHDAFVTKISPDGSSLLYSTFLGGSGTDKGNDIKIDDSGYIYTAGYTDSSDFPTQNPYQAAFGGGDWDAFNTKFSSDGSSLVYSTYLGGSNDDQANGLAVDGSGCTYILGVSKSNNFPIYNAYQPAFGGGTYDITVTKFDSNGSSLAYSTYLGGDGYDWGFAIAVDGSNCAYITGFNSYGDYPLQNAFQSIQRGYDDIVFSKFSADGTSLMFSTYFGGTGSDYGDGIVVDLHGNSYIVGSTKSLDLPTMNPFQADCGGGWDICVIKFNSDASALLYSTYLGGSSDDNGKHIALDGEDSAYITGYTKSDDFPTKEPFQGNFGGGNSDVIATKLTMCDLVNVFNLSSPSDEASDQNIDIVLDWDDAVNADSYDVYFGSAYPLPLAGNVITSEFDPGPLSYDQTYYWYVRAKNWCSEYTSAEWSFSTIHPPTVIIEGRVLCGGSGLEGIVMTGLSETPATTGTGYYTGTENYGWSGTVTPVLAGYSFTPNSISYNNVTENKSSQDYTATLNTYTIAGTVTSGGSGLSGVTIDGLPSSPITVADGTYSETVDYGWSGTTTPALSGYTFTPSNIPYSNVTSDQTGQDYTAALIGLAISGTVTESGSGLSGVVMNGLPAAPATIGDGTYTDTVTYGWSGTVTPVLSGYSFEPEYRDYSSIAADQTDQDYTAFAGYYNSPSNYQVIPEVLWAPATGGGTWMTEVQITDVTGGSEVSVYFNSAAGDRRGPIALFTGSGPATSAKAGNLLNTLDQLDPGFSYYGLVGAVEFVTQDADHKIHVIAKTKNGNYSKTFPGLNHNDDNTAGETRIMMIQNLANNDTFRTAYGGFNPTDDSITVEYELIAGDGSITGAPFTKTFSGRQYQAVNLFTEAGVPYPGYSYENVWLKITPTSGSGELMSYGATANNITSDPAVHIAAQAADIDGYNSPSSYQVIPEVLWAPATGGGTWMTEVQITDITGGSEVSVYFNASTGDRRGPITLFTGSGAGVSARTANLLATLDALDSGFDYYATVGTVEFVTQDDSHKIQVMGRTANGNYSKTFQGLNLNDANTASTERTLMVQNLVNDDTYRTAFGGFNPTDDDVTVEFTLMDENGSTIGTSFSKTFTGRRYQAFNPFTEAGVPYPGNSFDNTWIKVEVTAGSGQLMVYGATANNVTSDPAVHRAVQR